MLKEHKNGLYYHDTKDEKMRSKGDEEAVALVETVSGNATHFTKRQLVADKEARRLQSMIGRPSNNDCNVLITGNMLRNCPVTVEAIDIAKKYLDQMWHHSKAKQPGQNRRLYGATLFLSRYKSE